MSYNSLIQTIYNDKMNSFCFDCGAKNISFVSINNGIFLCNECATVHMSFPQEISIIENSDLAYELMKHFEVGKKTNNALKEIEVQLTMIPKGSSTETSYDFNNNTHNDKLNKKDHKMSAAMKASLLKDEEYRNVPYYHRHMQDICSKAGIVANDSPYITEEEKKRIEEKENRKKDISNKKFTSVLPKFPHNNNDGLDTLPIGNTEGYQFRGEDKSKWISKRGFQVYG